MPGMLFHWYNFVAKLNRAISRGPYIRPGPRPYKHTAGANGGLKPKIAAKIAGIFGRIFHVARPY